MRLLVVSNPVAGSGRVMKSARRLVQTLESRGHAVEWRTTSAPGEARRFAGEHEGRVDVVVVVGGDGTLNEVLNGLADPSATPLAMLALGTANLLARELGLPRAPEGVAELIERGAVRRLDLGRADAHRFLLLASSGFDAMVTQEVRQRRTGTLGFAGYAGPILRVLRRYRPPQLEIAIDAAPPLAAELVVVANVSHYAGLFRIAADARCDSGHFDVVCFPRARRRDLLRFALAGAQGRVAQLEAVAIHKGRSVRIESAEPAPVEIDGDDWGTTPVALELEPRVVPILVAPG